ncbi:MAG: hypothetical protein GY805_19480 [Chloroflexi bacterium]|nr:hypothetical protein [Chloroflexota bacterium]
MNDLREILLFLITAVSHVWPFFLISIVLSVLIQALKLDGMIRKTFDNKVGMAILLATVVGAFSPFCSCTVIPVIAGLLASGVPLAPIMSFWIASPTMDPEIFALSVGVLGWPIAIVRLVATLILSLSAGYITLALTRTVRFRSILPKFAAPAPQTAVPETCCTPEATPTGIALPMMQPMLATAGVSPAGVAPVSVTSACESDSCSLPVSQPNTAVSVGWHEQIQSSFQQIKWPDFLRQVAKESWNLGRWLLLAFLLEALITLYVPQEAIATSLGDSNQWAIPLAALIGIPLYLTNISALPIISGLLAQGMQPGAAIAFLIAGPVTTIPAMTAVWGVVHRRIFVLYITFGLVGAILLGIVANWFL